MSCCEHDLVNLDINSDEADVHGAFLDIRNVYEVRVRAVGWQFVMDALAIQTRERTDTDIYTENQAGGK